MTDQTPTSGSTPLAPDAGAPLPAAVEQPVAAQPVAGQPVAEGPTSAQPVVEQAAVDPAAAPVADVPADAAPPAESAAPASAARPGRGGRLAALAAVLVVTVALGALTLLLFQKSRDAREVASYYRPSSAPMSAARAAGKLLFSYDYKTIDKDFAAGAALTTGRFAKEYAQTTKTVVRPVAVENKAVVQASAVSQGLAEAEPGEAKVIVFVNQVTTSTKVEGQKIDQSRVRMTLVERDGEWLVSKVEAL